MSQRGVIAQLAILIARNVVCGSDCGKHLRLLHGVDAEIRFEVQIEIQHVFGIASLLHYQSEDAILHGIARYALRRCRNGCRFLIDCRGRRV